MHNSLVDWTNGWFYSPGCLQTPNHDRMMCYLTSIVLIGEIVNGNHPSKYRLVNLHDYLTYLLLGWNPITSWPKHSEYNKPSSGGFKDTEVITQHLKELLDFTSESNLSIGRSLVRNVARLFNEHARDHIELFCGEQLTMIFLSLWLVQRKTETPVDVMCARACLDLYYTSCNSGYRELDNEYATSSYEPNYCMWIYKQINRLLIVNEDEMTRLKSIAYFGWFMSLIRANRMISSLCRDSRWRIELCEILAHEVTKLRDVLNNKPLKIIDDTHRYFGATLFERLRFCKFKKRFH